MRTALDLLLRKFTRQQARTLRPHQLVLALKALLLLGLPLGWSPRAHASQMSIQARSGYYLMQTSGIISSSQTSLGNIAIGISVPVSRRVDIFSEYLNVPASDGFSGTLDHRFLGGAEFIVFGRSNGKRLVQPGLEVNLTPKQRFSILGAVSYGKFLLRRLDNLPLFEASTDYVAPVVGVNWYLAVSDWMSVVISTQAGYALGVRSPFSFSALYASGSAGVSVPL